VVITLEDSFHFHSDELRNSCAVANHMGPNFGGIAVFVGFLKLPQPLATNTAPQTVTDYTSGTSKP